MTTVRAEIKAIRRDHSRALVHAETPDGLELKLEVPLAEVEGLAFGTLVISYELERAPQPDASAELHHLLAPYLPKPTVAEAPQTAEADASAELHHLLAPYLPKPTVAAAEAPQTVEARLARLLRLTGTTT